MRFSKAVVLFWLSLGVVSAAACNSHGSPPATRLPLAPGAIQSPSDRPTVTSVALSDHFEADLDVSVISDRTYCEVGNDPAPCARFVVEIPHPGTVVVQMDSSSNLPMFIELGNGAEPAFVHGESPLTALSWADAGPLSFIVGAVPWGQLGTVVRYRVVATLE